MQFRVTAQAFRSQATCECGWQGKNRWLRGAAVGDAYLHGARTGHTPADVPVIAEGDTTLVILNAS